MSVHRGVPGPGGCLVLGVSGLMWGVPGSGGVWSDGRCLVLGEVWSCGVPGPGGGPVETPRMAIAADGTHPRGMHYCFV